MPPWGEGMGLGRALFRGEVAASVPFALFFALHIVFASAEMWTAFRLAAVIIFLLAHLHTPLALRFSRCELSERRALCWVTTFVAVVYSTGYWYGVNGMEFDAWILLAGLTPVVVTLLLLRLPIGQVEE